MGISTVIVGINSISNTAMSALAIMGALFFMIILVIMAVFVGVIWLITQLNKQQQVQTQTSQQTQQQNNNQQQTNTVSIDLRTLNNAKDGIFFSMLIIILIIFTAFVALGSATDVLQYGIVTFIIIVLSICAIAVLYDSFKSLKISLPKKVKKIIKKTIIYEDGTVDEKEIRY